MLKVSEINIKNLKNNRFEKELPELYQLKNVIENNSWHNHDPVFDHIIATLESLEGLLEKAKNKINLYLDQTVDKHTRKELLFLAALFHDIAKKETIVSEDGLTACLKHEEAGARKVKKILERFDLSDKEKDIVVRIIKHHGEIHVILDLDNKNLEKDYEKIKTKHADILLELVLLTTADTQASQLKDNDPEKFKYRMNFYNNIYANF